MAGDATLGRDPAGLRGGRPTGSQAALQAHMDDVTDPHGIDTDWTRELIASIALFSQDGAVGDGTTDDTVAMQATIDRAESEGLMVLVEPKTFRCQELTIPSYMKIEGCGRDKSVIKKAASGDLIKFHGVASLNHCTYCQMRDLTLWGNAQTGRLIDAVYADNLTLQNLFLRGNQGPGLECIEVWDSVFDNLVADACNSETEEAFIVASSRAAAGFGLGTDNSNVLRFNNCRAESWKAGAFRLRLGTGGVQNPNHIYLTQFKAESYFLRGPAFRVSEGNIVEMDRLYAHMGAFDPAWGTPSAQSAIRLDVGVSGSLRDSHISNDSGATISEGVYIWCGTPMHVENVQGQYAVAPTSGKHLNFAGGGPYVIGHSDASGVATDVYLAPGVVSYGQGPMFTKAGANPSDADFSTPPPIGTPALRTDTSEFFIKTAAATWKKVAVA